MMLEGMAPLIAFNSPLQLVFDNPSLVMMELVSFFLFLMSCIHAQGSPRRTQLLLGGLVAFHTLLLGLGQVDPHVAITWHSQAIVMLFHRHVPLYLVLLHASFYYLSVPSSFSDSSSHRRAYISTLKMHLHFSASIAAMGLISLAVVLPAEIVGAKLIWWTWHDTDPTLVDRFLNVPIAVLISHFVSASSFFLCHELFRSHWTPGFVYQLAATHTEHAVVVGAILASIPTTLLHFGLAFQLLHDVVGLSSHTILGCLVVVSFQLIWSSDRRGHMEHALVPWHYDGEWHHAWYDHALLQALFLYLVVTPVLVLVLKPTHLVSLGYHQLLGDCTTTSSYTTVLGTTHTRFTYLCHRHYDEAFSFCGAPASQLHVHDPWYKICGVDYEATSFAHYLVVLVVANTCLVMLFRDIFSLARPAWVHRLPPRQQAATTKL
ncbi:Aste57867_21623 [Aphanomyces stellatus]|uniref:Aste57867_21623 protein n=1 Tax=Aphanomyces stellatus TaxID=120398 RepID=A0A485LI06_9STRA|nr:hypothetical protein As57867_021554 [Aphanomyces stellatus]VFT98293.1 Aste57867_21623 [Aphanomyces stellatus]